MVLVVVVALGVIGALVVLLVRLLSRHWSRTREQANVVYGLQMALFGVVQSADQRVAAWRGDGHVTSAGPDREWTAADATARAAARANLGLLEDRQLRQLTVELLDRTHEMVTALDADAALCIRKDVETLQQSFRARTNEVMRDLRLRGR